MYSHEGIIRRYLYLNYMCILNDYICILIVLEVMHASEMYDFDMLEILTVFTISSYVEVFFEPSS